MGKSPLLDSLSGGRGGSRISPMTLSSPNIFFICKWVQQNRQYDLRPIPLAQLPVPSESYDGATKFPCLPPTKVVRYDGITHHGSSANEPAYITVQQYDSGHRSVDG